MRPAELREIRLRLGWSQIDTASRLGISHRGYRYAEEGINAHGKAQPEVARPVALAMLAFALVADVEESGVSGTRLLAEFRGAVRREAGMTPPPTEEP